MAPETIEGAVEAFMGMMDVLSMASPGGFSRAAPQGTRLFVTKGRLGLASGVFSRSRVACPAEITAFAEELTDAEWPWCVHVRGEPGIGLTQMAAKHNLTSRRPIRLMLCTPERLRFGLRPDPGMVKKLTSADHSTYVDLVAEGSTENHSLVDPPFTARLLDRPEVAAFVSMHDGRPVATATAISTGGFVNVAAVATVPGMRSRGHGRAVTEAALRWGVAGGMTAAYLEPSEAGLPLYESMGFETAETWTYLQKS